MAQIQNLIRELTSCKLHSVVKTTTTKPSKTEIKDGKHIFLKKKKNYLAALSISCGTWVAPKHVGS